MLWVKKNEVLPAFLSLCIHLGFVFSAATMSLYGGAAIGEGITEPFIIGIPVNVFLFSVMFAIQSTVLIFMLKQWVTEK